MLWTGTVRVQTVEHIIVNFNLVAIMALLHQAY